MCLIGDVSDQETLDKHLSLHNEQESFLYSLSRQSWFALLVMLLVCVFLILVAIFVFWYYKNSKGAKVSTACTRIHSVLAFESERLRTFASVVFFSSCCRLTGTSFRIEPLLRSTTVRCI